MRMLLGLSAILFVAGTAHADDCKGGKATTDAFSGATSVVFKTPYPGGAKPRAIRMLRAETSLSKDGAVVTFQLARDGAQEGTLAAGTVVGLRLDDGTILELTTSAPAPLTADVSGTLVFTSIPVTVAVAGPMVAQLAASPIAAIRIALPGGDETWETTAGSKKKLAAAWSCGAGLIGG